jgi:dTDP-4-amino-4,6-dideoxygalactose transaminase
MKSDPPKPDGEALGKDLTAQESIPEVGIERAVELMRSGRLFRYLETGGTADDVVMLEQDFATAMDRKYCVAMNSCGSTLFVALKCAGVIPGSRVLMNTFTLAPVPGAIDHAYGEPVLVDMTESYCIDLDDLVRKARSSESKLLLLSHMRGHIADMEQVASICGEFGLTLIEDCAHTMGASWADRPTGTFGAIGCFSAQSYKHLNSGEGGLLVTDDEDIAAKAILYSGSYMLYEQHLARPSREVFERWKGMVPNCSLRMSSLAAAVLRPQISLLADRVRRWNERYHWLENALRAVRAIQVPVREAKEQFVGSSLQFSIPSLQSAAIWTFLRRCQDRGVHLKWFGDPEPVGFTSVAHHWKYIRDAYETPNADRILKTTFDMRVPLSLDRKDCDLIVRIIRDALEHAIAAPATTD